MHGTKDLTVPFAQGEGLARAVPKAEFWRTEWTHNGCLMDPTYWGRIKDFLRKYALLARPGNAETTPQSN
jgi:fermentation-respiration switch protein FrsA (DUF1100 family)